MPVPEATVDENHGLESSQDNVGFAGQVGRVSAEPVSGAVQQLS